MRNHNLSVIDRKISYLKVLLNYFKHSYVFQIYLIYFLGSFAVLLLGFCNTETYDTLYSFSLSDTFLSSRIFSIDLNFFVMPIVAKINSYFQGVQLYAYFLFIETLIVGFLFLREILKLENIDHRKKNLLAIIFIVLFLPNFFLINITRISTYATLLFFYKHYKFQYTGWKLFLFMTLCISLRISTFVLISFLFFLLTTLLYKRFKLHALTPFGFGLTVSFAYNLYIIYFLNEPFNAFFFREWDLTERANIDMQYIRSLDKAILFSFNHGIFDQHFFNMEFLDSILETKGNYLFIALLNPKFYFKTFALSWDAISECLPIILIVFVMTCYLVFKKKLKFSIGSLMIFFPLIACICISLPERFLYPYYTICIMVLIYKFKPLILYQAFFLLVVVITFGKVENIYRTYLFESEKYKATIDRIDQLRKTYGEPLFIENYYSSKWRMDNPQINYKYEDKDIYFINYNLSLVLTDYEDKWKSLGCRNPLSIEDKFNLAHSLGKKIVFYSEDNAQAYIEYMKLKGSDVPLEYVVF